MRIRTKAILILAASAAVIGVSLVAISRTVLRAGFVALEERHALQDMEHVRKACAQRLESLGRTAGDWARWEDTWRFIQGEYTGFVAENLDDEGLAALDADLMVFLASDGRVVHQKVRQRPGVAVPPDIGNKLFALYAGEVVPPRFDIAFTRSGMLAVSETPLLFATHPVYHGDGSGPSAGRWYVGRFLDGERLALLSAEVGLALSIRSPDLLPRGSADLVRRLDDDRLLVQGLFTDPAGIPVFAMEISESRDIYHRGTATINTFLLLFMGVGLAVMAIFLLGLHVGVLARVESLDRQVRRIGEGLEDAQDVTVRGEDELSDLARSINAMRASLVRSHGALVRSERLAAVGTLAGSVAHQFNNLNTGLLSYTELALARPELDDETRGYLEKIVNCILRSATITRGLLAFSGEIQQAPIFCRLNEVVKETLPLVSREITHYEIALESRLTEVPAVPMDPALIQQVTLNILLNAIHAVIGRHERRIFVKTDVVGQFVQLIVRDTGRGISAGDLPHLFTPFFTTKGKHAPRDSSLTDTAGTGLGLSVSHAIVAQHGGRIEVESTEGVGSTFIILLPLEWTVPRAPASQAG